MSKRITFKLLDGYVAMKGFLSSFAMVGGVPVTTIEPTFRVQIGH